MTTDADTVHDLVVVGGGPGGYGVAFRAANRGLDVAMVEADALGGTCLNRGCIPSKTILHVAGVLHEAHRASDYGVQLEVGGIDGEVLDAFREQVMDRLRTGLTGLARQRTTYVEGRGHLGGRDGDTHLVEVDLVSGGTATLHGRNVVLATGSVPQVPSGWTVDGEVVQTSDEALWFTAAPDRAVIIGAGAIGMEFASMWAPMGTEVTVVEALDRALPLEDPDCSTAVERAYQQRGIDVRTATRVVGVRRDGDVGRVVVERDGEAEELVAEVVLVAVGRSPNTADTGAAEAGVLDGRGFVVTDDLGRTAVDGLWAVGDVRPTLALAHAAFAEGFVVADTIAGLDPRPVDHVQTPRVTYCHPEVASVGLTEPEARAQHGEVVTSTCSLQANARGIVHDSSGFVKVVAAKVAESAAHPDGIGATLGVHVVGPRATDLIGEATLATSWEALPGEVAAITHAHPTLYEAMGEAFMSLAGVGFHGH